MVEVLGLDDGPRAGRGGCRMSQVPPPLGSLWNPFLPSNRKAPRKTSRTAARIIAPAAPTLRERVLAYIAARGEDGATDEEGEDATGLKPQAYTPRRWELAKMGAVVDSGRRRPTRSGASAAVWVVTLGGVTAEPGRNAPTSGACATVVCGRNEP